MQAGFDPGPSILVVVDEGDKLDLSVNGRK